MTPNYEVGERVKVLLTLKGHTEARYYAATIITYWPHYSKRLEQEIYLYRISIDGLGDTYIAVEQEDGSLSMLRDEAEIETL